jgi:UrcA family protein
MRHLTLSLATAAAVALAFTAPAVAQPPDPILDELTITAHSLHDQPQSITERVSFNDLNLASARDRSVLLERVNDKAGQICDRLNEPPPSAGNLGHSCQEIAVRDAMSQVRQAYAQANSPADAGAASAPASDAASTTTTTAEAAATPASATVAAQQASVTFTDTVYTNGPIPDTPANRARFGGPMSRAGQHSAARGN